MAACGCTLLFACSDPVQDNAAEPAAVAANESLLRVQIVDADGMPLPGMIPVVSEEPSLMSPRVAEGTPADAEGLVKFTYPNDKWSYLRAADPEGKMMADGHVEIEPGETVDPEDPVVLTMAESASVSAELHDVNGAPIGNGHVGLVLLHPAHGQWWRAEGETDSSGRVAFAGLPAGVYALKLETDQAGEIAIREAVLVAGKSKDVGVLTPQTGE